MSRWWIGVALIIGLGVGFMFARATEGTSKRTVDVARTFVNPAAGETGTWAASTIRRYCGPGDVAAVRVTITRTSTPVTTSSAIDHTTDSITSTKTYKCADFMQQFKK